MTKTFDILLLSFSLMGFVTFGWVVAEGNTGLALNRYQIQEALGHSAREALDAAGCEWAGVEIDGQSAKVFGAPPSANAARRALAAVYASSGSGGWLWGGIISVSTAFDRIVDVKLSGSDLVIDAGRETNGQIMRLKS